MGDRDYTDLNSKVLIGLTNEVVKENSELVAERYTSWALKQNLPVAGSFALFKPVFDKVQNSYV